MMKKRIFLIFLVALVGLFVWISSRQKAHQVAEQVRVVTSGYVPYTLTKQIAGDTVHVQQLLPPGAEPHSFEPTPGAFVALNQADAFIYISDELEPWAADLAATVEDRVQILPLAAIFETSADPHVWMNLQKAKLMAYEISALLAQINPGERARYEQNYALLASQIEELEQQFKEVLSSCKHQQVVHIGHLAFGNLLRPYGIKLTALAGTSHEGEHSAKKIARLMWEIKSHRLPAIFTEESVSPRLAQTVAAETGVEILPLYSVEHISKQDFDSAVTYVDLMKRNLENLKRGLVCQAS